MWWLSSATPILKMLQSSLSLSLPLSLPLPLSLFLALSPPLSLSSSYPTSDKERVTDTLESPKYIGSSFIFMFMMTTFTSYYAHLTNNPNACGRSVYVRV